MSLRQFLSPLIGAVPDEGKDDGIGVKGSNTTEGQKLEIEVQGGCEKLGRGQQSDEHADQSPENREEGKVADDPVVVAKGFNTHVSGYPPRLLSLRRSLVPRHPPQPAWLGYTGHRTDRIAPPIRTQREIRVPVPSW